MSGMLGDGDGGYSSESASWMVSGGDVVGAYATNEVMPEDTANQVLDPLDLLGQRAKNTRNTIRDILTSSAQAGIDEQGRMQGQIDSLFRPFYDSGLKSFGDLRGMAMGGGLPPGYEVSKLMQLQAREGKKAINVNQAKSGLLNSSATKQKKSDLISGLAAEEAQRAYGGSLSQVQMGTSAADSINAASRSLGGNVGGLYSNLGSSLNANTQAYGQARQNSMNSLSNMFAGASSAYQSNQGGQ